MNHFKEKETVRITASEKLSEMNLLDMIGLSGVITECLIGNERDIPGCMVMFPEKFHGHFIWFIPVESLEIVS